MKHVDLTQLANMRPADQWVLVLVASLDFSEGTAVSQLLGQGWLSTTSKGYK